MDDIDKCPETALGEPVGEDGCSVSQKEKDPDLDGVPDDIDKCPETAQGEPVDEFGCSASQVKNDLD